MDIDINLVLTAVTNGGSFLLLYLGLFFLANVIYTKTVGYDLKEQIVGKDNAAVAIALAGYLFAISIIFIGCLLGPSKGLLQDVIVIVKYSVLGIFLLYIAHLVNDKLILYKFNNVKELVDDRNIGTAAVQAGSYVASGLIVAGAIHGEGGGLHTAIAFFLLGQLSLIIYTRIYNLITSYDIHDEIEKDNYSAGIAFSGTLIALGIILSKSAGGDFIGWADNLTAFLLNSLIAFVLLPVFRIVIDKLVITNEDLNKEIAIDKNNGAGFLEFSATVGFASVLFFVL